MCVRRASDQGGAPPNSARPPAKVTLRRAVAMWSGAEREPARDGSAGGRAPATGLWSGMVVLLVSLRSQPPSLRNHATERTIASICFVFFPLLPGTTSERSLNRKPYSRYEFQRSLITQVWPTERLQDAAAVLALRTKLTQVRACSPDPGSAARANFRQVCGR